jgi:hypothetical protein
MKITIRTAAIAGIICLSAAPAAAEQDRAGSAEICLSTEFFGSWQIHATDTDLIFSIGSMESRINPEYEFTFADFDKSFLSFVFRNGSLRLIDAIHPDMSIDGDFIDYFDIPRTWEVRIHDGSRLDSISNSEADAGKMSGIQTDTAEANGSENVVVDGFLEDINRILPDIAMTRRVLEILEGEEELHASIRDEGGKTIYHTVFSTAGFLEARLASDRLVAEVTELKQNPGCLASDWESLTSYQ